MKTKRLGTAFIGSLHIPVLEDQQVAMQNCYALYDPDKVQIQMLPGLKREMFVNSLLHELVHASLQINLAGVISCSEETEEAICRAVAHCIAQNRELIEKLTTKREAE